MLYRHLQQIQILLERKKYDIAQQRLSEALAEFPSSHELLFLQAEVLLQKDQIDEALVAIDQAIGINPEDDRCYSIKARVLMEKQEFNKAEDTIRQAIRIDSNFSYYFGLLAIILIKSRKYDQANIVAKRGLELDPDDSLCNNALSWVQNKLGKSEEAKERLQKVLADDPEDAFSHANLGYHYIQKGDPKKAKEHFAAALAINPNYKFAQEGLKMAIKSTNFLYRKHIQFRFWMQKYTAGQQWAFIIGAIVLINILPVLAPIYLVFILWSWFTEPLSDLILLFDRYGKYLMRKVARKIAWVNLGLLIFAVLSLILGIVWQPGFYALAFGAFVSVIPIWHIPRFSQPWQRTLMFIASSSFVGIGVMSVIAWFTERDYFFWLMSEIWATVIFSWAIAMISSAEQRRKK